jgi:hypothetical protein
MSGTPISLGQVALPILMFAMSGYSLARSYDESKKKGSMKKYIWLVVALVTAFGGYKTLTGGITARNLQARAQGAYTQFRAPGPQLAQPPVVGVPTNLGKPPV